MWGILSSCSFFVFIATFWSALALEDSSCSHQTLQWFWDEHSCAAYRKLIWLLSCGWFIETTFPLDKSTSTFWYLFLLLFVRVEQLVVVILQLEVLQVLLLQPLLQLHQFVNVYLLLFLQLCVWFLELRDCHRCAADVGWYVQMGVAQIGELSFIEVLGLILMEGRNGDIHLLGGGARYFAVQGELGGS